MAKNKVQEIIDNMIAIINEQKGKEFKFDTSLTQFRYSGNVKTEADIGKLRFNPTISIIGDDIQAFDALYFELYKELKVERKQVSLEQFKIDTRDLFFFEPTEEKFRQIIDEKYRQSELFYYMAPIYGIVCEDNKIDFGNVLFISNNYIKGYSSQLTDFEHKNVFLNALNDNPKEHMLYFVRKYQCYDAAFTQERFFQDLDEIINVLRFLCENKSERTYIDRIKLERNILSCAAFSKTKAIENSSIINMRDIAIKMDKTWFERKFVKKIMEIINKDNKTDWEKRVIRSLIWCGRSIEEYYLDLSCTEIAIAFESIFKSDKCRLITQSIQEQIAESTALILGNNYDEVIELIKKLKEFYGLRSAIAHGANKPADIETYNKGLVIFRNTIIKLLEDEKYSNCNSLEELKDLLGRRKYS